MKFDDGLEDHQQKKWYFHHVTEYPENRIIYALPVFYFKL